MKPSLLRARTQHDLRLVLMLSGTLCLSGCDDDSAHDAAGGGPSGTPDAAFADVGTPDASLPDAEVAFEPAPCLNAGTPGATAGCLSPTLSPEYYAEQGSIYFDTLDVDAPRGSLPNYSELAARWEWPPWLLLTGFTAADLIEDIDALMELDPSTVPVRDCRFFDTQPFARCYVVFEYRKGPCPIYEEFTFNDAGEMTFVEAWSDLPGMLPQDKETDPWAERTDIGRLSTRIPGLGNAEGRVDLDSEWMLAAAEQDEDVAKFALFATDWRMYWVQTLIDAPRDFFDIGCGWTE
ncbi:MAG: hypothetical protein ACE366_13940 [Bradymonadia bacterium]